MQPPLAAAQQSMHTAAAAAQLTVLPYAMPAMYRFLAHFSFTWLLGKALVRSVSCRDRQQQQQANSIK
jgi:hypothetical protein